MFRRATITWVAGLLTAVPYATWYLLFEAPREQYAALITFVLFWIFGYWGVVAPLLSALKVRAVLRAIETGRSPAKLRSALQSQDTEDALIRLLATEHGIPRFVAARVYRLVARRIDVETGSSGESTNSGTQKRPRANHTRPGD